jgi:hypothetical protein
MEVSGKQPSCQRWKELTRRVHVLILVLTYGTTICTVAYLCTKGHVDINTLKHPCEILPSIKKYSLVKSTSKN